MKYKILSYNICWECLTITNKGAAGNLGKKCINNVYMKNMTDYINNLNKNVRGLDFISLQEASNFDKFKTMINTFNINFDFVQSRSGYEDMVTCYNKKFKLQKSYCGEFFVGRPFQILIFNKLIFINLHYCNHGEICNLQQSLTKAINELEIKNIKNYKIIITGDFNFQAWKNMYPSEFQIKLQSNGIYRFKPFDHINKYVYVNNPPKTCCSNESVQEKKNMWSIGDFIMSTSQTTKNIIKNKQDLKGLTSDHFPVYSYC